MGNPITRLLERIRSRKRRDNYTETDVFLMTVGNVTLGWAGVERIIDELIAYYQHRYTDLSAQHPRNLSDKLKYLRRLQSDLRLTSETRDFVHKLRVEAKRLGNERHEIIHALLTRVDGNVARWGAQRVEYDGAVARLKHREFALADLENISVQISEFGQQLAPRVWVIMGRDRSAYPAYQIEDALRELGMT
jgi:hypothetical protein